MKNTLKKTQQSAYFNMFTFDRCQKLKHHQLCLLKQTKKLPESPTKHKTKKACACIQPLQRADCPWRFDSIARNFFFSKSTFFQCACVQKKCGLTHRPRSWLTTSSRTSVGSKTVRNRGATPKCHHSCKTAEHKSRITEICTLRPLCNENRARLLPEEWSGSCPALCFTRFTMNREL